MAHHIAFKKGDTVKFMSSPKSMDFTIAKVTKEATIVGSGRGAQPWLETTDDAGKVRKVRPSACQKVA